MRIDDRTANYGTEISETVDDYHDNTDMAWSDSEPAEIIYLEGNYGATGWIGGQQALSQTVPCFSWPSLALTGDCDDGQNKPDFSYIFLNTYYQDDLNTYIETIVRHEPGHVLGMAHTSCSTLAVMRLLCSTNLIDLGPHDKDHINDWY